MIIVVTILITLGVASLGNGMFLYYWKQQKVEGRPYMIVGAILTVIGQLLACPYLLFS